MKRQDVLDIMEILFAAGTVPERESERRYRVRMSDHMAAEFLKVPDLPRPQYTMTLYYKGTVKTYDIDYETWAWIEDAHERGADNIMSKHLKLIKQSALAKIGR